MRRYEFVFVLKANLDEAIRNSTKDEIKSFVEQAKGNVEKFVDFGKRKLTYEVEKEKEGYFIKAFIGMDLTRINELIEWMRTQDNIIRFVVVKARPDIASELETPERREANVNPE